VNGGCNDPVAVAGGYDHNCAILKDGSVWCWGFNQVGEVGDGTTGNRSQPVKVALPSQATAISARGVYLGGANYSAHTCVILSDQSVWCWGSNANGELGQGDTVVHSNPVQVKGLASITRISVGGAHTCAVNANNDLYCWGRNFYGQVGTGSAGAPVPMPQPILSGVTAKVALGGNSSCIIKTDKNLYCWGWNYNGQLGNGTLTDAHAPGPAVLGLSGVIEVAGGAASTCARDLSKVYCWGRNSGGELGLGNLTQQTTPQPVDILTNVLQLAACNHQGAITAGGVYMWGPDGDGQLGDGMNTSIVSTPEVVAALSNITMLGLSDRSSCGLTAAHQVYCWGYNAYGQLGIGTFVSSAVPVAVAWP
jgi:alpha-tubulin suppressor-like RCC1 family protein